MRDRARGASAATSSPASPARRLTLSRPSGDEGVQLVGAAGAPPRKAALGVGLAAKTAVGRRARVDRPVEAEMLANAALRKVHRTHQRRLELALVDVAGAVKVGVDRQR